MGEGPDLTGSVALVTGCGRRRGIGRATALALAGAGADVAIADIAASGLTHKGESSAGPPSGGLAELQAEIEALGRRALAVTGDVGNPDDAQSMVDAVIGGLGQLDILVNNAAAPHGEDRHPTWLVPIEAFESVMRTNSTGVFLMSSAVIRHLLERAVPGRIVNIASVAGKLGFADRSAYCASKFAVIGLTQVLAQEVAPNAITVNAVCPGPVATDRNAATQNRAASGDAGAAHASSSPVGRVGEPADIARAVMYLVDPRASFVTGQSLIVDGGIYMT